MTDNNYVHLSLLVDRSGSMEDMRDAAQTGINKTLAEQAAMPGKITVNLYDFNTSYRKVFGPIDAKEAPTYQMVPTGGTALIDSMMRAIEDTGSYLRTLPEALRPAKVLFVVITDGEENSSHSYTREQLSNKVTDQTDNWKWEFIFLGANIDAFRAAQSYGIRSSIQYAGTQAAMTTSYDTMSSSLGATRRAYAGGQSVNTASFMPTNIDAEGNATGAENTGTTDSTENQETQTVNP
jgi:hypothetical protein